MVGLLENGTESGGGEGGGESKPSLASRMGFSNWCANGSVSHSPAIPKEPNSGGPLAWVSCLSSEFFIGQPSQYTLK